MARLDGGRRHFSPTCFYCKHLKDQTKYRYKCKAFDLIPEKIWEGKNDHTSPYKGDRGVQFERKKVKKVEKDKQDEGLRRKWFED